MYLLISKVISESINYTDDRHEGMKWLTTINVAYRIRPIKRTVRVQVGKYF